MKKSKVSTTINFTDAICASGYVQIDDEVIKVSLSPKNGYVGVLIADRKKKKGALIYVKRTVKK